MLGWFRIPSRAVCLRRVLEEPSPGGIHSTIQIKALVRVSNSTDSAYRRPFYEQYVSGHRGIVEDSKSEPNLLRDVIPHVPPDRASAILDVGCGQGQLVGLLMRAGYTRASGIDTSPEQVSVAHQRGRGTIELGDLFEVAEHRRAQYDVVIAIDVVEHFERWDVERVFRAFVDLLTPGGRFILRTPNGSSPFAGRMRWGDLTHGVVYTRESLVQIGHLVGFSKVDVYPVRPAGVTMRRRVRRLGWTVLEAGIKLPLVIETGITRGHIVTQNLVAVATNDG